jgi:hypothetical protein
LLFKFLDFIISLLDVFLKALEVLFGLLELFLELFVISLKFLGFLDIFSLCSSLLADELSDSFVTLGVV